MNAGDRAKRSARNPTRPTPLVGPSTRKTRAFSDWIAKGSAGVRGSARTLALQPEGDRSVGGSIDVATHNNERSEAQ